MFAECWAAHTEEGTFGNGLYIFIFKVQSDILWLLLVAAGAALMCQTFIREAKSEKCICAKFFGLVIFLGTRYKQRLIVVMLTFIRVLSVQHCNTATTNCSYQEPNAFISIAEYFCEHQEYSDSNENLEKKRNSFNSRTIEQFQSKIKY